MGFGVLPQGSHNTPPPEVTTWLPFAPTTKSRPFPLQLSLPAYSSTERSPFLSWADSSSRPPGPHRNVSGSGRPFPTGLGEPPHCPLPSLLSGRVVKVRQGPQWEPAGECPHKQWLGELSGDKEASCFCSAALSFTVSAPKHPEVLEPALTLSELEPGPRERDGDTSVPSDSTVTLELENHYPPLLLERSWD